MAGRGGVSYCPAAIVRAGFLSGIGTNDVLQGVASAVVETGHQLPPPFAALAPCSWRASSRVGGLWKVDASQQAVG